MDALSYFLFHSLVYNLLLGVAFTGLGLLGGWWIWGRWQRRAEATEVRLQFAQTQLVRLRGEIEPLRAAASQAEARLQAAEAARVELQNRLDTLGSRTSRLELERQSSARLLEEARQQAADASARLAKLEASRKPPPNDETQL
ncbi:MAG: hypothetical protein JSR82_16775 [Verrucomicrobia bacterium]|nr:hypothetical protein [Verrucomicrobiota bacterium]